MTDPQALSLQGIEQLPMGRFTEDAYLNYSMYVIMDRALPHIGDDEACTTSYCICDE